VSDDEIADRRELFERLSRRSPAPSAEEFIEHKIEIVRSDPDLTDAEKDRAIAELRGKQRSAGE
jgi:hypothetical protein